MVNEHIINSQMMMLSHILFQECPHLAEFNNHSITLLKHNTPYNIRYTKEDIPHLTLGNFIKYINKTYRNLT